MLVFIRILTTLMLTLGGTSLPDVIAQTLRVSQSGTYYVSPTGNDVLSCGIASTTPCKTIQYAVNLIPYSGEGTIRVAAGNYVYTTGIRDECLLFLTSTAVVCIINKRLSIIGGYTTTNWIQPDSIANSTIISGQNQYRGVWITSTGPTASLTLKNFIITGGLARGISGRPSPERYFALGGGLFAENTTDLYLDNLVITNNSAIGTSTVGSTDTVVGGAAVGGGIALKSVSHLIMTNITSSYNKTIGGTGAQRSGYSHGAGMFTYDTTGVITNMVLQNNQATTLSCACDGKEIATGERADAQGGGVAFKEGSVITATRLVVTGNQAIGGDARLYPGAGFGGGVYLENQGTTASTSVTLYDITVSNNSATGGNGHDGWIGEGGGIFAWDSSLVVDRGRLTGNSAIGGNGAVNSGPAGGGGAAIVRVGSLNLTHRLTNILIADNTVRIGTGFTQGGGGGGLWLQGTNITVTHATLARNQLVTSNTGATGTIGQAILAMNYGVAHATNAIFKYSIIADHICCTDAALNVQTGNTVSLDYTLWAGNTNQMAGYGTLIDNNALNVTGTNSAGFVSPGFPGFDYHIVQSSPARSQAAGSTTVVDADNLPRIGIPDIGAYQYHHFAYSTYVPGVTR